MAQVLMALGHSSSQSADGKVLYFETYRLRFADNNPLLKITPDS